MSCSHPYILDIPIVLLSVIFVERLAVMSDADGCVTLSYRYTSHSAYSDTLDDFLRAVLRWLFTIRLLRNGRRGFFQVSTMKSHRIADPQHRINKTSIRWTDFHIEA